VIEAGGQTKRYSAVTARQPSFRVPRRPPGRRDAVVGAGTVVVATGTLSRGESGPGPARPAIATPPTASAAPSGTSSPPAPPSQGQTPSLALPAPAPNSSTPAAGPSRGAPASVTVLAANGQLLVETWNGPTTAPSAFGPGSTVTAGSRVGVICSAYGQPVALNGATARLWDYTTAGWLNDQLLQTNSPDPVVPACLGNVRSLYPGSGPPRRDTGPFPVITDTGPSLRDSPSPSGAVTAAVGDGDPVQLSCSVHSTFVPAPSRLAGAGSNDQWDRVVSPAGWLPDSYVDSHTSGSAAPPC
jgi:hypothetical protein